MKTSKYLNSQIKRRNSACGPKLTLLPVPDTGSEWRAKHAPIAMPEVQQHTKQRKTSVQETREVTQKFIEALSKFAKDGDFLKSEGKSNASLKVQPIRRVS